ncbi:hypothetical protein J2T57_001506 [Natronocella acetinitrilica]|uniref:GIY-YIG domain-containing protein n=1 Tax=Natronocella acetinitrilica TaxID=414046 RepID=A0AAE3KB58_9GAMM|nr:GIY-YIG nuclease family protein [Natronocella acetinitrilica]MCP1674404.1 hypothetical protein [Natronocella acetinitrilica]
MTGRPKTIQLFLPSGDPRGIRIAEFTTRNLQVIDVPRRHLMTFLGMPEAGRVGIYFLVRESRQGTQSCYIGKAGVISRRLETHEQKRADWDRALVVISSNSSLTEAHALYLEYRALEIARSVSRYAIRNDRAGTCPHLTPSLQADCDELVETANCLLGAVGVDILDDQAGTARAAGAEEYTCTVRGADARAVLTASGLCVLRGSRCAEPAGGAGDGARRPLREQERERERLVEQGVIVRKAGVLVFARDHVFPTPGDASRVIGLAIANPFSDWVGESGEPLPDLIEPRAA